MISHVDCLHTENGTEPASFRLEEKRIVVTHVIDRWLAEDHAYFKVAGDDSNVYILGHDAAASQWEMTFFQRTADKIPPASSRLLH